MIAVAEIDHSRHPCLPQNSHIPVQQKGDAQGVGSLRSYTWSSRLPYRLSFNMRTTAVTRPTLMEGIASGDLDGKGRWRLEPLGERPRVQYEWTVVVGKPWMRAFAPLLAPVFAWNHDPVMREGGRGIARHLGVALIAYEGSSTTQAAGVGGLELAPAVKALSTTPSTYIWSIAADQSGNLYAATGAPARVYRITPQGQSTTIFEPQELQVQALAVDKNGILYAATNPDGKVYRIERMANISASSAASNKSKVEGDKTKSASEFSASVFFDPHTKYIWDLVFDNAGNLYVATGDHGEIYRITPKGEHSVFFKSDEAHIRAMAVDAKGNLIAGSDGSGLVYQIKPDGEGFVLYSAPKKEITALAIDKAGNIYAAAGGEKRPGATPSFPSSPVSAATPPSGPGQSGAVILNVTPAVPGLTGGIPFPGAGSSGGSEIYRIAPDGSPSRIWSSSQDLVYALAFDRAGRLLAGTGNRGHIFAITGEDQFVDLLKASASQITAFAEAPGGGLYVSTSNLGKLLLLGGSPEAEGTYESDVFDAKVFSRWGRAEFRGAGNVELFARSGNVDNPDRNWSPWKPVDLQKDPVLNVPPARFVQWKTVLRAGATAPSVDSVLLNYLPKNVAPDFDDVTVQVGYRYQSLPKPVGTPDNSATSGNTIRFDAPPPSTRDRDSIGVKLDGARR